MSFIFHSILIPVHRVQHVHAQEALEARSRSMDARFVSGSRSTVGVPRVVPGEDGDAEAGDDRRFTQLQRTRSFCINQDEGRVAQKDETAHLLWLDLRRDELDVSLPALSRVPGASSMSEHVLIPQILRHTRPALGQSMVPAMKTEFLRRTGYVKPSARKAASSSPSPRGRQQVRHEAQDEAGARYTWRGSAAVLQRSRASGGGWCLSCVARRRTVLAAPCLYVVRGARFQRKHTSAPEDVSQRRASKGETLGHAPRGSYACAEATRRNRTCFYAKHDSSTSGAGGTTG
ncbi:hypothetical protein DFH07DRAFT_175713 [Mycena maculata]|uniref:Uncharacterized protein n=1 Tax=Mycena maculata TaxID=230809 RepID=A0AAD7MS46_9AGAR|nr:hypothetical protein DFH07DRAFT_175713 [Mycena maculata]